MPGQPKIAATALKRNTPGAAHNCAHHAPPGAEAPGQGLQAAITKTNARLRSSVVPCCTVLRPFPLRNELFMAAGLWPLHIRQLALLRCRPAVPLTSFDRALVRAQYRRSLQQGAGSRPKACYPGPGPAPGFARRNCPVLGPGPGAGCLDGRVVRLICF